MPTRSTRIRYHHPTRFGLNHAYGSVHDTQVSQKSIKGLNDALAFSDSGSLNVVVCPHQYDEMQMAPSNNNHTFLARPISCLLPKPSTCSYLSVCCLEKTFNNPRGKDMVPFSTNSWRANTARGRAMSKQYLVDVPPSGSKSMEEHPRPCQRHVTPSDFRSYLAAAAVWGRCLYLQR